MSVSCKTAKEIGEAIKREEDSIEICGDLATKTLRIKATGKVAWGVLCVGSLGTAITACIAAPVIIPAITTTTTPVGGGAAALSCFGVAATATTVASATLGSATVAAITIGVAAGGIGALNSLRDKYKIVEKGDKYLRLKRK